MVRKEVTQTRLVILAAALILAVLAFGLVGTATAAGPDTSDLEIQPVEGTVFVTHPIIRCPDRLCPDGGSGCSCKRPHENRPPIRLPIELTTAGNATSDGMLSTLGTASKQVSEMPSVIQCPDRFCPDGGRGCGCRGEDRPPIRLLIGHPGAPVLTE